MEYEFKDDANRFADLVKSPILFHQGYVFVTGSNDGALLLNQLVYWTDHLKKPFSWSQEDITKTISISDKEQKRIRTRLVKLGILEEFRVGQPARMFYFINKAALKDFMLANEEEIKDMMKPSSEVKPMADDLLNQEKVRTRLSKMTELESSKERIKNRQTSLSLFNIKEKEEKENKKEIKAAPTPPVFSSDIHREVYMKIACDLKEISPVSRYFWLPDDTGELTIPPIEKPFPADGVFEILVKYAVGLGTADTNMFEKADLRKKMLSLDEYKKRDPMRTLRKWIVDDLDERKKKAEANLYSKFKV